MYSEPHVELVDEKSSDAEDEGSGDESGESGEDGEKSGDAMLDDYLARNAGVVIKNIEEDKLTDEQLTSLLELENSTKKRATVIDAINNKLEQNKSNN